MSPDSRPQRRFSTVRATDDDCSVRLLRRSQLEQLQHESRDHGLSARWSSIEALRAQVDESSPVFVCPVFRLGGPVVEPPAYRCHIWFLSAVTGQGSVSLFDIGVDTFTRLRRLEGDDMFQALTRLLLDSHGMTRID
ncbi:hypothetical protein FB566_1806 [Stackebrandtia endophytica]|uniref:Uncharacterized protein n=1 Tax=Stackebrandtia endophytica TaxID=1496996 RepID=A0A543AUM7_9ACTN|nr:hypothetical protein FB566_1806 [Stackebrandtia endophytica]